MNFKVHSCSPTETFRIGRAIGEELRGMELVLISGDLGAGKTLLTKGIATSLGIDPGEVVSPTFVLMNMYRGEKILYHFDLYRLGMNDHVTDPGIEEYLGDGVVIVEWAQFLNEDYVSDTPQIEIDIAVCGEDDREISIETQLDYIHPPALESGSQNLIELPGCG